MSEILDAISHIIAKHGSKIEQWIESHYKDSPPPFYSSVDIRHSGQKLTPVDTNLFPAGFNNLSDSSIEYAAKLVKSYFEKYFPKANKIILLSENHTRNTFYLKNLESLKKILELSNKEVQIGSLLDKKSIEEATGIELHKIIKQGNNIVCDNGFRPDVIINNNDMSDCIPDIIKGIVQPVIPSPNYSWSLRRKSKHFEAYNKLIIEFSKDFDLDPFLLSAQVKQCGTVNFKERTGLDCVATNVDKMIHVLKQEYIKYGIKDDPYVFIKADSGTYGMGIMTARSGNEVTEMNKKIRNKMNSIKGGGDNTQVIIQEGIVTIDEVNGQTAEPMLYLMTGKAIELIYRIHESKDAYSNLNAPGMSFKAMACQDSDNQLCDIAHFQCFGLISRLATLASTKE